MSNTPVYQRDRDNTRKYQPVLSSSSSSSPISANRADKNQSVRSNLTPASRVYNHELRINYTRQHRQRRRLRQRPTTLLIDPSILDHDMDHLNGIETFLKNLKKERLVAKRNMLLPNKSKVQVDLEKREMKIAKALHPSIKSMGGMEDSTARTIVEHASKRMSTSGEENRLIDSWEEVENQLEQEIYNCDKKIHRSNERKYRLLKQRQKKMFEVRLNAVVDRQQRELRQKNADESRRRRLDKMGTRKNNSSGGGGGGGGGSFQHLNKESRRVWGKFNA